MARSQPTPYYSDESVTLWQGDCRPFMAQMDDASIDCVITDPPFSSWTHENVRSNSDGARRHGNRVLSGNFGFDAVTGDEVGEVLAEAGRITRGWVVAHLDYRQAVPMHDSPPRGLRLLRVGAWIKTNPNPQISGDRPAQGWEAIAFLHRTDRRPVWSGGGRACNFYMPSSQGTGHPTSKPLALTADLVRKFTKPGDVIFDPFAGSGTTLRAAVDEGRTAVGVEIDAAFCEIAKRRLSQGVLDFGEVS